MTSVDEIAPEVFRISTFVPEVNLHFNQFLVRDEEPLLYHTGMRWLFPAVRDAVAQLIDPAALRWIGFSHFESDECGSLREWQELAPQATAVCGHIGKNVSVDDVVALRPARGLDDDEVFSTGQYRFRFLATPHVPHCWDAGLLFEETKGTLFCSDLLHQNGQVEPLTASDVVGRFRQTLESYEKGPFAGYMPYTHNTPVTLERLAKLEPKTLAVMHGSAYTGDGARAIRDMGEVLRDVLGPQ
ncbi:MAG TPA: MBL fold metallo-hydrolase [Gammaproteobacteria bacterium]|nr:MBL fold metallo-hydrolase [Gammaproteobacteria bacterium]HRP86747.1 MBL fold metallo-hydrolase [Gammaproteobacteria bacterium]